LVKPKLKTGVLEFSLPLRCKRKNGDKSFTARNLYDLRAFLIKKGHCNNL